MRIKPIQFLLLGSACLLLLLIAWQYPATTTFPIGGDAATYVINTRSILAHNSSSLKTISETWYPLIYPILALTALIPHIDWPTRFTWVMATGQLFVGLSLGLLAYRLKNVETAAIAIALWALTPITLNSMFEDGTLAQLWSFGWLLLFLERSVAGSLPWAALFLGLALIAHPLTAVVAILTLGVFTFTSFSIDYRAGKHPSKFVKWFFAITITIILLFIIALIIRPDILSIKFTSEHSPYVDEMISGLFAPWTLLSIVGFFLYARHKPVTNNKINTIALLGSFTFISLILATSDYFGIGFWTRRFSPYLSLSICLMAAYAFPYVVSQILTKPWTRFILYLLIFSSLGLGVWHENLAIYHRYESPATYGRLQAGEKSAIMWLQANLPADSQIFTTQENRHSEWISALTNLTLVSGDADPFLQMQVKKVPLTADAYAMYFLRREKSPLFISNTNTYRIVYQSAWAVIAKRNPIPSINN